MAAMVGLNRLALILRLLKAYWESIPDSLDDIRHKHYLCDPGAWQTVLEEHKALNTSITQVKEVPCPGPTPCPPACQLPSLQLTSDLHDSCLGQALNRVWVRAQQHII